MKILLKTIAVLTLLSLSLAASAASWPPVKETVFCWRAGTQEMNQLIGGKNAAVIDGQLRCSGGTASAEIICAISQEMTLDFAFAPERLTKIKARIFDIAGQLSIWQVNDQISLQLPGSKTLQPLTTLPDTSPLQLSLVLKDKVVKLYMYGLPADVEIAAPALNIAARSKITVASNKWKGTIFALAIYPQALPDEQIAQSEEAMSDFMRQLSQLRDKRVFVRASVTNFTPTPTPEAIAPYRHALIVFEYRVDEVIAGENDVLKTGILLRVARWGILGGRQTAVKDSRIGNNEWLMLEPFDARPDLAEQYTVDKLPENFDLLYYIEVN